MQEEDLPLAHAWTFWHESRMLMPMPKPRKGKPPPKKRFENKLTCVGTVDSIHTFWNYYNNLFTIRDVAFRDILHFFRHGVEPTWEDHRTGGQFVFRIPHDESVELWRDLQLGLIGKTLDVAMDGQRPAALSYVNDTISGISVSSRKDDDVFTIWHKTSDAWQSEEEESTSGTFDHAIRHAISTVLGKEMGEIAYYKKIEI